MKWMSWPHSIRSKSKNGSMNRKKSSTLNGPRRSNKKRLRHGNLKRHKERDKG